MGVGREMGRGRWGGEGVGGMRTGLEEHVFPQVGVGGGGVGVRTGPEEQ